MNRSGGADGRSEPNDLVTEAAPDTVADPVSLDIPWHRQLLLDLLSLVLVVFDVAERLDEQLDGRRANVLAGAIFASAVGGALGGVSKWIPIGTAVLLLALCGVLAIGLAGAMRDERGEFDGGKLARRIMESGGNAWATVVGDPVQGLLVSALASAGVGFAFANVAALFGMAELAANVRSGAWVALLVAGGTWAFRHWRDNRDALPAATLPRAAAAIGDQIVLSSSDEAGLRNLREQHRGTVLGEFVGVVSTWRPRPSDYEADYQVALLRRVLRHHPRLRIEREKHLKAEGSAERMRPDFVLAESLILELKRDVSVASFDRCVTQLAKYSAVWGDKGLVVLLVCHADPELVKRRLTQRLAVMRFERPFVTFVLEA